MSYMKELAIAVEEAGETTTSLSEAQVIALLAPLRSRLRHTNMTEENLTKMYKELSAAQKVLDALVNEVYLARHEIRERRPIKVTYHHYKKH